MELVLHYAIIGFRPFPEIGEFINVGVLAVESRSRYLAYRLLPTNRTKRVRSCFPEIELAIYRAGLSRLENELSTLALETNMWTDDANRSGQTHPAQIDLFSGEGCAELFELLSRSRSSSFFFPIKGARLAGDLDSAIDDLFARYVEHQNLTPIDYEEKKLTRGLKVILRRAKLDQYYRECPKVGTDSYHVGIPLGYLREGEEVPQKAIKPLNLTQSSPTRIYTHGDEWIAKVNRLRSLGKLPKEFLFAVSKPESGPEKQAADDICESLADTKAEVAAITDEERIIEFAKVDEPEDLELIAD